MYEKYKQQQFELLPGIASILKKEDESFYPEMEFESVSAMNTVSRNSPVYIKWVQSSLNKILGDK